MLRECLLGLLTAAAIAQPPRPEALMETHSSTRPDGSHLVYFTGAAAQDRQEAFMVLQGTGCDNVNTNRNLQLAASVIDPSARAIFVQKYGVTGLKTGSEIEGCPEQFWRHETLHQRVIDCLQVIAELRQTAWWNRRVVIFGGSEGGAVAGLLAPLVPETTAVIIFSSGTGTPIRELIGPSSSAGGSQGGIDVFEAARADPTWAKLSGGLSYMWLADAADIVPARSLLLTPAPVLFIHGAQDRSLPVSTSRAGEKMLLTGGKTNATYLEYPEWDHAMVDQEGRSHLNEVFVDAGKWLRKAKSAP